MSKFNYITIMNTVLLVLFAFSTFYLNRSKQEVVYVDNIMLFNDFNMTKNIRAIEEVKISTLERELDSLFILFKGIKDVESDIFKEMQQQVVNKNENLKDIQSNYMKSLNSRVWNRLNSYIKEYAKINKLKIILGTNGNGNIMFAEKSIDITNQVIEFSNYKYEGGN